MPLPSPQKNQKKKEFITSCMGDNTMNKEFPKAPQRYAVCQSIWDRKSKKAQGFNLALNWDEVKKENYFIVP